MFQISIGQISDNLSLSVRDLIIDDEDLDSVLVAKDDFLEAEAMCGLAAGWRVLARPGLVLLWCKVTNVFASIQSGSKMSSADPRNVYKQFGILSLKKDTPPPEYGNVDSNFNFNCPELTRIIQLWEAAATTWYYDQIYVHIWFTFSQL